MISKGAARGPALRDALDAALEGSITRATRVFARRQRTWLREQPVTWLAPGQVLAPEELD